MRLTRKLKSYYCEEVLQELFAAGRHQPEKLPDLTEKEKEVIRLIGKGETAEKIGAQMFVSGRTIETYKRAIAEKLGVKTAAEIVLAGVCAGIIDLREWAGHHGFALQS